MNKDLLTSIGFVATIIAVSVGVGYYWGRANTPEPKVTEKIEYVPYPYPVRDTINRPIPIEVRDTIYKPVPVPTDTAALFAVWRDYYLRREYELDFSNDSVGVFKVNASVQENKLLSATSVIQPNRKVITRTETVLKVPTIQPWIMIGTSPTFDSQKIQFGLDFKNRYIFGLSGIRIDDKYNYTLDFGVKF